MTKHCARPDRTRRARVPQAAGRRPRAGPPLPRSGPLRRSRGPGMAPLMGRSPRVASDAREVTSQQGRFATRGAALAWVRRG